MRIYIQSKSGDLNSLHTHDNVISCWDRIREMGGYETENRQGKMVFVPLHEIEYIREADEDD